MDQKSSPAKPELKLYLLSQTQNNDYDTYDSCVVAAMSRARARKIHPNNSGAKNWHKGSSSQLDTWCIPQYVRVDLLGVAAEGVVVGSVLCASFHAG